MKYLLPLVLTLVSGCSTQFQPAPHGPQKDLQHDPVVVFMGDEITHNWLASGVLEQHPMWVDKSSTTLETSASMLARFQADVLDQKPDVVHILCCQGDMDAPGEDCSQTTSVCGNVDQMVLQATAAGLKVVIGSVTPWGEGPLATQIDPDVANYRSFNIEEFNYGLLFYLDPDYFTNVGVADYHGALAVAGENGYDGIDKGDGGEYQPALTTDGVNPDAAGYAIMTTMAEQAINYFQVGGTKESNLIRRAQ